MVSEVQQRASFDHIRYAQVWEDADVLVEALAPGPGKTFLSIASAGDNALALLAAGPDRVVALDLSPAQIACLELRVAAFRALEHPEFLDLLGARSVPADRRQELYRRCRPHLSAAAAAFWEALPGWWETGFGHAGKFENYFRLFRQRVLPLVHARRTILALLESRPGPAAREEFYQSRWDTWRWRLLFRFFFSRPVMGRMGRDPAFFRYVEGSVADRILARTRHALTRLHPAENPYLEWILTGGFRRALPFYLRPANFAAIRENLDRLSWSQSSLEAWLAAHPGERFDGFNLSDIFEYMSEENHDTILHHLLAAARPGARLAYWNMLVPRARPPSLAHRLKSLPDLAAGLLARDKAFFYSAFILEEVLP